MKKTIFNIESEYLAIIGQIENNEGVLTDEMVLALAINQQELETKSMKYVQVIKTIDSEVDLIDSEIKRLQALKSSKVNTVSRLKEAITHAMKLYFIDEIKTPLVTINFRNSKSVIVDDIELLPADCIIVEKKSISKAELKKRIESGELINGARVVENKNLQIK